jgi:putative ABC transport system substrate-binding protein
MEFITLLGGTAVWPLTTHAQQLAMPVIGFLNSASPDGYQTGLTAFRQGLQESGYVEGQNVAIEYRWAEGYHDRLPALAADLVRRQVTVIVTSGGTPSALQAATSTIPIVFYVGVDLVERGLVASYNSPSGNLTGVTQADKSLMPKRLELANELLPKTALVAVLANPNSDHDIKPARDTEKTRGRDLIIVGASTEHGACEFAGPGN